MFEGLGGSVPQDDPQVLTLLISFVKPLRTFSEQTYHPMILLARIAELDPDFLNA